eukprot:CAMPEP_0174373094 /NCGR_PEP_ID=MMETSP0811_2-20130205/105774_1 /TAXON_ID=73025 ORGANISM="Eutreptiella gymnastica-like, Strain CCMP1594" /NCGR_SAMPLE_ID=MMETSP0811_2 /ASSEMBLY_ACC=CAM_ASM_000667 /LENGTH=94 /DNA_ID=CAMNT_0015521073 /DNA_START=465 /DNA_END=749 /DNA_ORIENTATION=-
MIPKAAGLPQADMLRPIALQSVLQKWTPVASGARPRPNGGTGASSESGALASVYIYGSACPFHFHALLSTTVEAPPEFWTPTARRCISRGAPPK